MFLTDNPKNWSIQVHFFAYARNTEPLAHVHISPYEIVFYTQSRIPLIVQLNLSRNPCSECAAHYCSELPPLSPYQATDINPLFH